MALNGSQLTGLGEVGDHRKKGVLLPTATKYLTRSNLRRKVSFGLVFEWVESIVQGRRGGRKMQPQPMCPQSGSRELKEMDQVINFKFHPRDPRPPAKLYVL